MINTKKILIKGKNFYLKNFEKNLINKNYLSWFNQSKNYKYIVNSSNNMSIKKLKNYVNKNLKNKKILFLSIFSKKENLHIGNVRLLFNLKKSVNFSIIIGDQKYRNKGLGSEVLTTCTNYIFRQFKLNSINAEVIFHNKAAVKIYEKCDFYVSKIYFKKFKNKKTKFMLMTKNNKDRVQHLAFIPARRGSLGFKFKNRVFFRNTADFLKNNKIFDRTIVSTNDNKIKKIARNYNFEVHNRKNDLSGPKVSIKNTLTNFIKEKKISEKNIIWLFYLPILYKKKNDFKLAKKITFSKDFKSLCSFKNIKTSPFNCWFKKNGKMSQFIKNDFYRRQDLPKTYIHYHYLCAFKVKYLKQLNSELICNKTIPIILTDKTSSKLIEIDTKQDYKFWKKNLAGNK